MVQALAQTDLSEGQVPQWTIITVSYNSAEPLDAHWRGFRDYLTSGTIEWIVVDNASTDESSAVASSLGAKVLSLESNRGFSAANNAAARVARGRRLLFVNPDVTIEGASLPLLARELDRRGGIVAPQLKNEDGSLQPNGRGLPFLTRKIRNRLRKESATQDSYRRYAMPGCVIRVDWVIGAVVGISASDFASLKGWNQDFFLYYEDSDFCLRASAAGFPISVVGDVVWTHSWARETRRISIKPWKHEIASLVKFYKEYPYLLLPSRLSRISRRGH